MRNFPCWTRAELILARTQIHRLLWFITTTFKTERLTVLAVTALVRTGQPEQPDWSPLLNAARCIQNVAMALKLSRITRNRMVPRRRSLTIETVHVLMRMA